MAHLFDPANVQPEKLLVTPAPDPAELEPEELKERIAGVIRSNAKERGALTASAVVATVVPDPPRLGALLSEMAGEASYADIKAVITDSGVPYLYSETYIQGPQAVEKAFVEECEYAIAYRVRAESRGHIALTPAGALRELMPGTEPEKIAAIVKGMAADPRYADIKAIAGPKGELYLHSDRYLSGNYAVILVRAMAKNPCATIALTVRDAAKLYPRPTDSRLFLEKAFGIEAADLQGRIEEVLATPEYADIRRMVHPSTGAVYLYSNQYLTEESAFRIMDWEEVGRAANP